MKTRNYLLLPMLAVALAACMPIISKQSCVKTNWYQRGMNDGSHGASANVQPYAAQCAKYHINIDTSAYYQGWRRALQTFCTYNNGLGYGQKGQGIPSGCAGGMGRQFYKGWQSGIKSFCSYSKGFNLASEGKDSPGICHGAIANKFQEGYQAGLRKFCSYSKGLYLGSAGKGKPSICSGANDDDFNRGYQTGTNKYCGNLNSGYSVGRDGLAYPAACSPDQYPAFYNAYQNGAAYHHRTSNYQASLDKINARISALINRYRYHENADGSYRMSSRHNTLHAKEHLVELNRLFKQRAELENDIFKQNVKHRKNWNNNGGGDGPIIINIKR